MMTGLVTVLGLLCVAQLASSATVSSDKLVATINKKDYEKFVIELSKDGVDTNQPDSKGKLAMVEAARTRELRFVDSLIQYGAFVKVSDVTSGTTPLHAAVQTGSAEIVRLLLAYGANPDTPDKAGRSPRQVVGSQVKIRDLLEKFDLHGATAFEDPPGTWTKTKKDKSDDEYWYNPKTSEARWNQPPSCAWQRLDVQGQPAKFVNAITGQETVRVPVALSWRQIRMTGTEDLWYNWILNTSQYETPQEVPDFMLKEMKNGKNVRWYNDKTGEHSWEDPKFHTHWRVINDAAGKPYYYNIETAQTQWELPDQLSWKKMESDDHPGSFYFYNAKTGESTWETPAHLSWSRHDSDI